MRHMDDRRNDAPPPAPCFAVADEQTIAEQRRQAMPHLRALPLETVVMLDKSGSDRVWAVAHEQRSREQASGKHLPLEAPVFPNREKIAPRQTQRGERRQRPRRPVGIRWNELVHGLR